MRRSETNSTAQQRSASAVRKLILAATGLVCLTGVSYFIGTAVGEGGRAAEDVPTKIGLIDTAYIFSNYEKLKVLQQGLKDEQQEMAADLQKKSQALRALAEEARQFKEGEPEYAAREQKYTSMASQFEAAKKTAQRKIQRSEAQMLQSVYLEMQDMVTKVANSKNYGYTIVLRFSRDEFSADPQRLGEGLSRQVVFSREADDISEIVLNLLNKQYAKSQPASAAPSGAPPTTAGDTKEPARKTPSTVKQAGGTKPGTQK